MDNKHSIISEAVSKGRSVLSEYESKTFLASRGIPFAMDELVETLSEAGKAAGVETSVCGEMASDPLSAFLLQTIRT